MFYVIIINSDLSLKYIRNVKRQTRNCGPLHPQKVLRHQLPHLSFRLLLGPDWNRWCKWLLSFQLTHHLPFRLTRMARSMERKKHSLWLGSWDSVENLTLAWTDLWERWTSSPSRSETMFHPESHSFSLFAPWECGLAFVLRFER